MTKDFVAVGYSCVDEYKSIDRCYPTGNGINVAIQLAEAGFSTAVITAVGDDDYGKMIIDTLIKKKGRCIPCSHCKRM